AHAVPLGAGWTLSELVVALAGLVYLALDVPLGAAMLATAALVDLVARAVDDPVVGGAAFVLGWIFQAIGHAVYEKNSPAFFRNLVHLLVGPAYLVNKVLRIRPAAAATL
ncbi:MAG TPA: Mpo1-like protein, partial [Thermoanaerobaculia bacterium]|nr:Mpo1-like protein [Thermoanaerobaculia bacterium]